MARIILGLLGLISGQFTDRFLDLFKTYAIETSAEDVTVRSWVSPAIRKEGNSIALVCAKGDRSYRVMMALTGLAGLAVLLFPRQYLAVAERLLFQSDSSIEWNPVFAKGVRIVGLVYVWLVYRAFRSP